MKILVIIGECVQRNTSANLCHLAYLRGMIDAGHDVTLLSADGRDYELDPSMVIPGEVKQVTYYGVSLYEKLSLRKKQTYGPDTGTPKAGREKEGHSPNFKSKVIQRVKRMILASYGVHGIYGKFVKKAQKYRFDEKFDYIISISTPVTGHLLAHNLIKARHIRGRHWIQIWEDPWYSDAFGFNKKNKIYKEEGRLLSFAERVCYVSPLTLKNQKKLFPESAHKMYWQPLPYYYKGKGTTKKEDTDRGNVYGYFGDYAPIVRNLEPFYKAAVQEGIEVNICGNPNDLFESTEHIHIFPRLSLEQLEPVEDRSNVLIFLCNRKGGQIPGKIYQYSATTKTILFILDGTTEEREALRAYFEPLGRYVFCLNTVEDIRKAISDIETGSLGAVKNEPIEEFNPREIVRRILEGK